MPFLPGHSDWKARKAVDTELVAASCALALASELLGQSSAIGLVSGHSPSPPSSAASLNTPGCPRKLQLAG